MDIGLQRDPHVAVAQHLADAFDIHILLDAACGVGVPQGMEISIRDARSFQQRPISVLHSTHLFEGDWGQALRYLVPVLAFLLGIYIAECVHRHFKRMEKVHWRQLIILAEIVLLYPVGRKVAEGVKKLGFKAEGDFQHMADKPSYQEAAALAEDLMRRFLHRDIDKVELLYNHFRSTAVQVLTRETYLPIDLTQEKKEEDKGRIPDYIVEPSVDVVMGELLPKVLRMKMFTVLLDSNASEHAARTMAMQIATDNANDLLQDLTVMYNKSRQQAITNELLDIVGGSMA